MLNYHIVNPQMDWADAESTTSYSSDLHFSVFQNRPYRGAFNMFKNMFEKVLQ